MSCDGRVVKASDSKSDGVTRTGSNPVRSEFFFCRCKKIYCNDIDQNLLNIKSHRLMYFSRSIKNISKIRLITEHKYKNSIIGLVLFLFPIFSCLRFLIHSQNNLWKLIQNFK